MPYPKNIRSLLGKRGGMTTITVYLPEQVQQALNRTPGEMERDVKLYAALMLYQLGKLSSGMAAQMAGLSRVEFLHLCGEYGISVFQYTPEELALELENG
jgi:predicted HTH domain antitoxin